MMPDVAANVPTYVDKDTTLRIKVVDACGMTCTFCHNEGTPVVADNSRRTAGEFVTAGTSGRVSIYAASNGANFLPATVEPSEEYQRALIALRELGLTELHITGGEPTLHPRLVEVVRLARDVGYRVHMTSNGEHGADVLGACARAGLDHVNFSVFGTTASELAQVQSTRFQDTARAARKIEALRASIATCERYGIGARANIVVLDDTHVERVHRLLDEYSSTISVRLLNSLDHGTASVAAIERVLAERGAVAVADHVTAGVSGARTEYRMADGRHISFKRLRPTRLPDTCAGCRFNNGTDCQEGFYGLRLYRDRDGRWMVGVCIRRMDLCQPLDEFLHGELATEVVRFREAEYARLTQNASSLPSCVPRSSRQRRAHRIMMTEHEAKVLEIDPDEFEHRVVALGGRRIDGARQRRYVYDIVPGDQSRWVRLRDTGTETTLTIKEIADDGIDGTTETEVTVSDFETTNILLGKLGYRPKAYQENTRVRFELDGAEVTIDAWPHIPPYAEIEAESTSAVLAVADRLGYAEQDLTGENTTKIYARYGIDLSSISYLAFPEDANAKQS
nr:radical SAM protein [Actinopolyspora erythraea]